MYSPRHWRVRNTIQPGQRNVGTRNTTQRAPLVRQNGKSNLMAAMTSNPYYQRVQANNGKGWKFAPINRSGWGKTRKQRKSRKNRSEGRN